SRSSVLSTGKRSPRRRPPRRASTARRRASPQVRVVRPHGACVSKPVAGEQTSRQRLVPSGQEAVNQFSRSRAECTVKSVPRIARRVGFQPGGSQATGGSGAGVTSAVQWRQRGGRTGSFLEGRVRGPFGA